MDKRKKIIIPIIIVTIVILLLGATFAYWRWQTQRNEEVNIALTFSGSSDDLYARIEGGEPITNVDVTLLPTNNCLGNTALQRTVSITYKNATSQSAKVEAQLDVTAFQLQSGRTLIDDDLSHIHWAITTNSGSCSTDVVSSGTFEGITFTNSQISNMTNDSSYGNIYSLNSGNPMITISAPSGMQNETTSSNYYAYVWIDEEYRYTNLGNEVTDPMSDFYLQLTWHGKIYQKAPGPNEPEIVDGLIPVKLSASGDTVTTVSENDVTWYNYDDKKWANAVLVTNNGTHGNGTTREYYLTHIGETVAESDILAYYVWIPRYSYQVWAYSGSDSAGSPHEIPIKFVDIDIIDEASAIGDYYTHPAFWWDNDSDGVREEGEELSGIWVGKFKTHHTSFTTTSSQNLNCTSSSCDSSKYNNLRILPNVRPITGNAPKSGFFLSRSMETSGNDFGIDPSTTDSHMMKNSEWGAVAYLSHSKYGINGEIRANNTMNIVYNGDTRTFLTGCGAGTPDEEVEAACDIQYGAVLSGIYPQSTTGNVTGIFDMSTSQTTYEYVMGFYGSDSTYDAKYYDSYSGNQFYANTGLESLDNCTLATCGGHALNETKKWYNDYASFGSSNLVCFYRGGYGNPSGAGLFSVGGQNCVGYGNYSFRLVLIKDN